MASEELILIESVECPICCERFDEQDLCPRLLFCGHSFCSGCLERLVNDNAIDCPMCKKAVHLPNGVAGLPKNFALLDIVSVTPQKERKEGLPICEVCDDEHPATSWCFDCKEDMCKSAARFHTRNKASREHQVVSLEPSPVSVLCSKHNEQFRLFDMHNGNMVCRSCITGGKWHRNVVSLAEAGSKCKEKIEALATKAISRAERIKAAEALVVNESSDAKKACEEQRSRIQSVFQELRGAITAREQTLLNELEQLHDNKTAILTEQQGRLRDRQAYIQSTVQEVLSTIQSLDNANRLATSSAMESKLFAIKNQSDMLEPEAQCVPEFTFDEGRLKHLYDAVNKLGKVSDKSTCVETTIASGSGLGLTKLGEEAFFTITACDAQSRPRSLGGDLFSVILKSPSGKTFVVNVEDKGNGRYGASYTVPADSRPGCYALNVRLRGTHILGSPFTVRVEPILRYKPRRGLSGVVSKLKKF